MILLIKVLHSLFYIFMSLCIFYLYYAGITQSYDWKLAVAAAAILLELVVLLLNGGRCPLTKLAKSLGDETGDDLIADLLLPRWAVPLTVPTCAVLVVVALLLLTVQFLRL